MCIASGGLLGLGPGRGYLKGIFAADSDIAFATISEEWGLLIALMMVLCVIALGLFALRTARVARSSFYTIGVYGSGNSGGSDHSQLPGYAGCSAYDRCDVPIPQQRRHQYDRCLGIAGLRQGGGYPENASFAVRLFKRGGMRMNRVRKRAGILLVLC